MTIPALPTAAELLGSWTIADDDVGIRCVVHLKMADGGPDHPLLSRSGCLSALGLGGAVGWRGTSDGLALVTDAGGIVAFFERNAASTYRLPRGGRSDLKMRRPSAVTR